MASAPVTPPAADPFAEANAANIEDIFGEGSWGGDTLTAEPDGDATEFASGEPAPVVAAPALTPSVGAEEGEGVVAPAAAPEPPAAPVVAPTNEQLELASLRQQVADLAKAAEEAKAPVVAAPEATPAPEAPAAVKFEMPPQLRDALLGEDQDQFTAGINHLVSGILTTVQQAIVPLQQELAALKAAGTTPPATTVSESSPDNLEARSAGMREEYFGEFPTHRATEFQPIIAAVATEMAAQYPGHAWNAEYRAAMGVRVTEKAKAVAALMKSTSLAPPPNLFQPGARSAAPAPGSMDISDEIEATLGFG